MNKNLLGVLKMMAKDPRQRFPSLKHMLVALRDIDEALEESKATKPAEEQDETFA